VKEASSESSSTFIGFDPDLVKDREVLFAAHAGEVNGLTSLGSPDPQSRGFGRPWDLVGMLVGSDGCSTYMFTRPRPHQVSAPLCSWMDLRGALAEAFLAGALSRHRKGLPEEVLTIVRSEAASYADKNHKAVGQ
jgi:hypothetical protein